jgi:hypothetical protein
MSSDSELEQPLLSSDSKESNDLSKLQPCANFLLLDSVLNKWCVGTMYKEHKSLKGETSTGFISGMKLMGLRFSRKVSNIAKAAVLTDKETKFVSYKFLHDGRKFCLTFRKHPRGDGVGLDVYNIRLSLIEPADNTNLSERKSIDGNLTETPIKCRGSESLIIKNASESLTLPNTVKYANFSSITSGDTPDQIAVVKDMKDMKEMTEDEIKTTGKEQFKIFFKEYIEKNIVTLADILLKHCDSINSVNASQGGATRRHKRLTRRRKRLVGRKGKKTYRKKKYGKTKKSRRFRRSVRSRR